MNAATDGPSGPSLFSMFSGQGDGLYRAKSETFVFSLLGQAVIVGLLVYFTSCVIRSTPEITRQFPKINELTLVFAGKGGGGGGNFDQLPASRGNPPPEHRSPIN